MKNSLIAVVSTTALLTVGGAASAVVNLIQNGSFESNSVGTIYPTDWNVIDNQTITSVQSSADGYTAEDGSNFLLFGGDEHPGVPTYFEQNNIATTAGEAYDLSFYLEGDGTGPSPFYFQWHGEPELVSLDSVPDQGWTKYSYTVTGTGNNSIVFGLEDDGGHDALDNVSLTPEAAAVPEPGTPAVFAFGLLTLGGIILMRRSNRRVLADLKNS